MSLQKSIGFNAGSAIFEIKKCTSEEKGFVAVN